MMKKLWITLLSAAVMLCSTPILTAAEEPDQPQEGFTGVLIDDPESELSKEEYFEITQLLYEIGLSTNWNTGVMIGRNMDTVMEAEDVAAQVYADTFGETDGLFFYMDCAEDAPLYYLSAYGDAQLYLTSAWQDNRIESILLDMDSFLYPPLDAFGALKILCTDMSYYYESGESEYAESDTPASGMYCYLENDEMVCAETPPAPQADVQEESTENRQQISDLSGAGGAVLYDEAQRLDQKEYQQCLAYLQDAANQTGMNVAMVLGAQKRSEYTIESLADNSYDELFGPNTDGLLYYMDLSGNSSPYDYISTCGMGQMYYTNDDVYDRVNAIFDEVFPYLYPAGCEDVVGAIEEFSNQVVFYYNEGVPHNYYVYDDVFEEYYYVKDGKLAASSTKPYIDIAALFFTGMIGLIIGAVAALITFFSVKMHYKFKSALAPTAYVNRKTLVFHKQDDRFVRQYTTKVRIESSSGGGRSGGGGGGRSSGGHGGGGRHR